MNTLLIVGLSIAYGAGIGAARMSDVDMGYSRRNNVFSILSYVFWPIAVLVATAIGVYQGLRER